MDILIRATVASLILIAFFLLPDRTTAAITPPGTLISVKAEAQYLSATYDPMPISESNTVTITVDYPTNVSIGIAKTLEDGKFVQLKPEIVVGGTSELGGVFYLESVERSAGIRVVTDQTINEGSNVTVAGVLQTVNGERQIAALEVITNSIGNPLPSPIAFVQKWFTHPPDNIGLLGKIWGRAIPGPAGSDWFYVDDGSGLKDPLGNSGVRVLSPLPSGYADKLVTVVGIHGVEIIDSQPIHVVRVRRTSDISILVGD
jgi:hypothetical protein